MSSAASLALRPSPDRWLIAGCLAATWFIWGSTYLAIKWALDALPPFFQMGTRFLAAAAVLAAWAAWRGARWPTRREWLSAGVLGALLVGGGYGFTAVAQTQVSSALIVAYIAITPALIALADRLYGHKPTRLETAGITLGLAGTVLLVQGQGFAASPGGWLAQSVACVAWTLGSVWSVRGLPGGFKLALAEGSAGWASQMACGGAMLLVVSWALGEQPDWSSSNGDGAHGARALWAWLYTVIAGTLVAYTAYMVLLQRVSPALASSYAFVNPVIGMLLGATLGGEFVSRGEWFAAGLAVLGVLLLVAAKRARASRPGRD